MNQNFFFVTSLSDVVITLDEDTSKHIAVLRMHKGDEVMLTDGKGKIATAVIADANRKKTVVEIKNIETKEEKQNKTTIAISLIKNSSRFEWFLEKATEIGVSEIIPLICDRTEKEKFRYDRMNNILISAMLQSQQAWLPLLHEPTKFEEVIKNAKQTEKFIAHCLNHKKQELAVSHSPAITLQSSIMLIGPEGDFTQPEIDAALTSGFLPVTLGHTRLRTETAGIVAATLLTHLVRQS